MDRYEYLKDISRGTEGEVKLMKDIASEELVAIKYIQRGHHITEQMRRGIINHRLLRHPNLIAFKEVFLTPTHLALVMEYAGGGELYYLVDGGNRLSEEKARFFFKQLISVVSYLHKNQVCHRDLTVQNMLLEDKSSTPRLKLCDFGFSKSLTMHSPPNSFCGTPDYMAPEVIANTMANYNGMMVDVWSCGVALYVMLVDAHPFEDPDDKESFPKAKERIMNIEYYFPPNVLVSPECQDLLSRIFVCEPTERISIEEIKKHPWFLGKLLHEEDIGESTESSTHNDDDDDDEIAELPEAKQSLEEVEYILREASQIAIDLTT